VSQGTEWDPDERIDSSRGTFDIENEGREGADRESGTAGLPSQDDVPEETLEEIERERAERLDPANRPDDTEVDNTGRTFDSGAGMYTDNPEYDESDRPFLTEEGKAPPKPSGEDPQST
jgi:hypothetical protein